MCAKELGIKPVNDLMEKMGITEDQMEAMEAELNELMTTNPEENENSDDGEDGFVPGGAATFPFLQNIFQGMTTVLNRCRIAKLPKREKENIKRSANILTPIVRI